MEHILGHDCLLRKRTKHGRIIRRPRTKLLDQTMHKNGNRSYEQLKEMAQRRDWRHFCTELVQRLQNT